MVAGVEGGREMGADGRTPRAEVPARGRRWIGRIAAEAGRCAAPSPWSRRRAPGRRRPAAGG